MTRLRSEFRFLLALWTANLQAAMEFRAAFLAQVIGMILNNAAYFIFWVIFFDRFKAVRGWGLSDMFILFGIAAAAFGLAVYLFGNMNNLSEIIAKGQLDYYLSLPRPVLLHTLASRSIPSGMGDFTYGILSFIAAGQFTLDAYLRFMAGVLLGMLVFLSFMTLVHSLSFFMGNANLLSQQAFMAIITFAIYPINLFEGGARFVLFVLVPAAFMGAVPAEFVRSASWASLLQLLGAALILAALAVLVFHRGLRRYESGSAIQVQI
jgi:ABC-2 type transport system permease protein